MSPTPIELWLTFTAALLASGHCLGMCGAMVTALGFHRSGESPNAPQHTNLMIRHLLYATSRLSTYLLLGGISGWLGSMAPHLGRSPYLAALPLFIAGMAMIVMGIETWGVWKLPLAGGLLARMEKSQNETSSWKKPLFLGILTGLLPCGLHWAFQAKAFATGSVSGGLLILAAFGLGTLPAMLGLGFVITLMGQKMRQTLQRFAALLVIAMGIMALVKGFHKLGSMG